MSKTHEPDSSHQEQGHTQDTHEASVVTEQHSAGEQALATALSPDSEATQTTDPAQYVEAAPSATATEAAPVAETTQFTEAAPAAPAAPATPPPASPGATASHEAEPEKRLLTTFMKVSIGILTVVTLASITLLFIGDFEGKFERVFSTITLFAVFVLLTAFDTRRERKNEWYAPVALIANSYILGLLLIVIWITPYDPFSLQWTILWKSAFVIVTTRLVTFGMELLLKIGEGRPGALGRWGQLTSILGILSLIMFTAPVGIEAFSVIVPDVYWKIAVATLILTALGLAITLLLNWYYRADEKPTRAQVAAAQPQQAYPAHMQAQQQQQQQPAPAPVHAQQQAQAAPVADHQQQPLLPWPTFADGSPLPMGADGQPDFSVLQQSGQPYTQQN